MSELLATAPRLPDEADTVEGRLADLMEDAVIELDEYKLSETDKARIILALRRAVHL